MTIERLERSQGRIMLGLGVTISSAGVLGFISAAFLESARRMNASFYSAAARIEVDPGIDPTTVALGAGGLAMMGGGVYVFNQGVSVLGRVRSRHNQ